MIVSGSDYDCLSQAQIDDIIAQSTYCYTLFNGTNEGVRFGNDASVSFERTDPFSTSIWFKTSDVAGVAAFRNLIGKKGVQGYFNPLLFGEIYFILQGNGNSAQIKSGTGLFPANTWTNVICTSDGSGTSAGLNIYVNNVVSSNVSVSTPITVTLLDTSDLTVGATSNVSANYFDGAMSNAAVFSKELTLSEVATIYGKGRVNVDYSSIPNLEFHSKLSTLNPVDETGINNGTSVNMDSSNIECTV
jgi:hypothetical protein